MENIRAVLLHARKAYELAQCSPQFRYVNGERVPTGYTFSRLQMGIDFGFILDRMDVSAGHARTVRFLAWVDGEPWGEFPPIERKQLESEALLFRRLSIEGGYERLFG